MILLPTQLHLSPPSFQPAYDRSSLIAHHTFPLLASTVLYLVREFPVQTLHLALGTEL